MKLPLARIVILLPVLWLTPCLAASKHHKLNAKPPAYDFSRPVATLATPEKNVAIFQMAGSESAEWTYVIVRVDEDGTRITYGDEKTVGAIVKELTGSLVAGRTAGRATASIDSGDSGDPGSQPLSISGERNDHRCTVSSGWRFETRNVRVNYCNDGFETARIERAIDLLNLTPSQL